jgi:endoglucanase
MNMNQIRKFAGALSFCTVLCALPFYSNAQGFLKADGKKIVDEKGKEILLRGVGLGGWMVQEGYMLGLQQEGQQYKIRERIQSLIGETETARFYGGWLSNHTTRQDIKAMKEWGFNSVRLPMHYDLYTLPIEKEPTAGKDTWLEKGFALTDSLLNWCKENQMYLILDLHAAPGGQGNDLNISDRNPDHPSLWDSRENQRKTTALWKKLAERYASEPWIGGYDILNEPNWGFEDQKNDAHGTKEQKNALLKQVLIDITKSIREVDQKHLIIIEGNGWGNNYNGMLPPWDNNMVLSFHRYWNYNNEESIKGILEKRDQYKVPVWVGETGENSNVWFTESISLLEKNDIGWCWWPLKKLGFNNPLEVSSNPDYQQVLAYWNKKGPEPSKETALKGLMQLKNDLKFGHNIQHPDVIDAMFRQVKTTSTKPFKNWVLKEKGSLEIPAVDYDFGRNGYAYFDKDTADYHSSTGVTTTGNRGRVYRNDGVDIKKESEHQLYVSDTEEGEWLQYTFTVEKTGLYTIALETSSKGKALVAVDGRKQTGIPAKVKLNKGIHQLRIIIEQGGIDLKKITLSAL